MDEAVLFELGGDAEAALAVFAEVDAALESIEIRIQSVAEAAMQLDSLTGAADGAATAANGAAASADGLATAASGVDGAAAGAAASLDGMASSAAGSAAAMDASAASVAGASAAQGASAAAAGANAAAHDNLGAAFLAAGGKVKMMGLLAGVAGGLFVKMGMDGQNSLSVVGALTGATADQMKAYTSGAEDLAQQMGVSMKSAGDGLYYVASAGFTNADAFTVLKPAMMDAKSGFADVGTVADGLTSTMNAYGASANQAQHYSDLMLEAVTQGKQTFQDFASSIGVAAVTGRNAGFSFDQVAAAEATMTQSGLSAHRAAMDLDRMMNAVGLDTAKTADSAKALGLNFDSTKYNSLDLIGKLEYLKSVTGDNTSAFEKLVGGAPGLTAANILLAEKGGKTAAVYDQVHDSMLHASDGAGATANAFQVHQQTLGAHLDELGAKVSVLSEKFVNWITPAASAVADGLGNAIKFLSDHAEIGIPVMILLATVVGTIVVAALVSMAVAAWAAVAPLLPFIAIGVLVVGAIVGIVLAVKALVDHWSQIQHFFQGIGDGIRTWFVDKFEGAKHAVEKFVGDLLGPFKHLFDQLIGHSIIPDLVTGIVNFFTGMPGQVLSGIGSFFEDLPKHFLDMGGNIVSSLVNALKNGAGAVLQGAKDLGGHVLGGFKSILGIASPSRAMMELGGHTADGFILGLLGQQGQVNAAVQGMIGLGSGTGGIRVGGVPVGATASGAGAAAAGGLGLGGIGANAAQSQALMTQMVALLQQIAQQQSSSSGSGSGPTTVGDVNQTFNGASAAAMAQVAADTVRQRNMRLNLATRGGGNYLTRGWIGGSRL